MGRYIDLAESVLRPDRASGAGSPDCPSASKSGFCKADQNTEWVRETLRSICHLYPSGMFEWLEMAKPDLHQILTVELIAEIEELWVSTASADRFRDLLNHFKKTFLAACLLFETSHAQRPVQEFFQLQLAIPELIHVQEENRHAA